MSLRFRKLVKRVLRVSRPPHSTDLSRWLIVWGIVLAALATTGCSGTSENTPPPPIDGSIEIQFSNAGERTWVGVLLPQNGSEFEAGNDWYCETQGDYCAISPPDTLGELEVVASSIGRSVHRSQLQLEWLSAKEEVLEIEFQHGGIIAGHVVGRTGDAVTSAVVEIRKQSKYRDTLPTEARTFSVETDDSGRIESAALGVGGYQANVGAPGFAPFEFDFEMDDDRSVELNIELVTEAHASVLRGEVIDGQSLMPVESFEVELLRAGADAGKSVKRRFENDDGTFEWSGLAHGNHQVRVRAEGYAPFYADHLAMPEGETFDVQFALKSGSRVTGKVVDSATRVGVPNARITVYRDLSSAIWSEVQPEELASIRANGSGWFEFGGLTSENVSIMVEANGYAESQVTVHLQEGSEIEIELRRGTTIRGQIIDGGRPEVLEGAEVSLWRWWGRSERRDIQTTNLNEDATFEFHGAVPGSYTARLTYAYGHVHESFDVGITQGVQEVVVRVPEGHEIEARVHGYVSGLLPRESARVGLWGVYDPVDVGQDGFYQIEVPIIRGVWQIGVRTERGRSMTESLELEAGDSKTVNFSLSRGNRLWGKVRRNGAPVPGAVLSAYSKQNSASFKSQPTNRDGRYEIIGMSDGGFRVYVEDRQLEVLVKGDTRFDFDLCRRPVTDQYEGAYMRDGELLCDDLMITGRVLSSGVGLSEASLVLMGNKLEPRYAVTDSRGEFQFGNLVADEYQISVHGSGYRPFIQRVTLPTETVGLNAELEIMLKSDGTVPFIVDAPIAPRFVLTEVQDNRGGRFWIPIPIDGAGRGRLPTWFAGRDFSLKHPLYEPVPVTGWRGQEFEFNFSRCEKTRWHECLGWPWPNRTSRTWPYVEFR